MPTESEPELSPCPKCKGKKNYKSKSGKRREYPCGKCNGSGLARESDLGTTDTPAPDNGQTEPIIRYPSPMGTFPNTGVTDDEARQHMKNIEARQSPLPESCDDRTDKRTT